MLNRFLMQAALNIPLTVYGSNIFILMMISFEIINVSAFMLFYRYFIIGKKYLVPIIYTTYRRYYYFVFLLSVLPMNHTEPY